MNQAAFAEWRAHWPVVLAALTAMAMGSLHIYSLGVMMFPLQEEFGWTRAQISTGPLISSVFSVVLSPFAGMAIDRFGPRRIALPGIIVFSLALAMLSQASPSIWTWWALWVLIALAFLLLKATLWVAAIASFFTASRGLAIAVVLCATGISSALTPTITYHLVEDYGWRIAYLILGVGACSVALPMLYFWFSSAQDRARMRPAEASNTSRATMTGMSLRHALTSVIFYQMGATVLIMAAANMAVAINLVPILTSNGLTRASAAGIAGVVGLASIIGRLSCGYLLDRFNARIVASISVLLPIITCILLLTMPLSVEAAMVAVFALGLTAGAELDAVAYLSVRYFGLRRFGVIFGTIMGLVTLGTGLGPVLANHTYDVTKSYELVLWALMGLSALTSILFLTLGPYPNFKDATVATPTDA